jgi:hypothetical protein
MNQSSLKLRTRLVGRELLTRVCLLTERMDAPSHKSGEVGQPGDTTFSRSRLAPVTP